MRWSASACESGTAACIRDREAQAWRGAATFATTSEAPTATATAAMVQSTLEVSELD